ncbi:MAG: type II toxin-antitoxin system RelE/ParE family toxin [Polyangiaceae bacterium]|nr:type II toxin-antitoxin system RelE/ParE family toxin [Polyangiaceae bacterium]
MSDPLNIVFTRRAEWQIETIDTWWETNRSTAPLLFKRELTSTLELIAVSPTIGTPARSRRLTGVRRVLTKKTRYHVYYRAKRNELVVLAVWHAKRLAPHL